MKFPALVILFIIFQTSFACSCITLDTSYSKKTLKGYDYIVRGVVEGADTIEVTGSYDSLTDAGCDSLPSVGGHWKTIYNVYLLKYKIKIFSYFKIDGKLRSDYIYAITGTGGGDCGYPFTIGMEYIIYGDKYKGDNPDKQLLITTNICTRTTSNITTEIPKLSKVYKERLVKD